MPRDRRPEAERRRRHRESYPLALELGITPREAEAELDRREVAARHREGARALAARMNAPLPRPMTDPEPPRAPWWQQD